MIKKLLSITVKQGNFDQFWRFFKSSGNMLHHASPSYWMYKNMIISFKFYTCSISDDVKVTSSKTCKSYPVKWGNFDRTWSNFNRTWGNYDQPIKVTPSVNKVNIVIVNKNKLSFLWHLFWGKKHVGKWVNKKKSIFMFIFLILVTLIATLG